MRVLFAIHELALNGAVIALLQQVRRMAARGDAVTVIVPELEGPAAALLPQFQAAGAQVVRDADPEAQDIFVGCTIFSAPMLRGLIGKVPTVCWIHEAKAGVTFIAGRNSDIQTLCQVNRLIFPNRIVAEQVWGPLLASLPLGRIEIVPCAVPPPVLTGDAAPRRAGRARVMCVGSVHPRKRQADLVQAVHMLRHAALDCVLVGQGEMLPESCKAIMQADPDRYICPGGVTPEELGAWYRSADLFCLPSEDESMPLAPVEAAGFGIPVILSDLHCYRDTWRHGHNALIHRVGDVEMLAWYLRMLIESPAIRQRLVAAAREVPLRFSEARAAALFDAALGDAVAAFRTGA